MLDAANNVAFVHAYSVEANRDDYYRRLRAISDEGDWTGWIEFFLAAIEHQAVDNANRVKLMLQLYDDMKQRIMELTLSKYSLRVLDTLFDRPIFQSSDFIHRSEVPEESAMKLLRMLREEGVLVVIREASGPQSAILAFRELLNLAEGRTVL